MKLAPAIGLVLLACSDEPDIPSLLAAPDSESRWTGFAWMTREDMVANLDHLIEMAESEPNDELRREVVRQLGYSRDPRVLPVIERFVGTDLNREAMQSFAFYGDPEGCGRLVELHLHPERWGEDPVYIGPGSVPASAIRAVEVEETLVMLAPDCLDDLVPYAESHPSRIRAITRYGDRYPAMERLRKAEWR